MVFITEKPCPLYGEVLINQTTLQEVTQLLKEKKLTIGVAESCTGGLLSHILTNISGSSSYFDRGIVTYSNKAKQEILQVQKSTLETHGAVSLQIAEEMAQGVKEQSQVDIGVSTTGVAGPRGGTKEKPVGLVFIGVAYQNGVVTKRFQFHGDRLENKIATCNAVLQLLRELLTVSV